MFKYPAHRLGLLCIRYRFLLPGKLFILNFDSITLNLMRSFIGFYSFGLNLMTIIDNLAIASQSELEMYTTVNLFLIT